MDTAKLKAELAATVCLYTSDGDRSGASPTRSTSSRVVWYPIKAFEAAGYKVPDDLGRADRAVRQIVADGNGSPWCIGIEAGAATGWIATDWVEDVMLRTAGIDAYNKWISHELPFNSPEIKAAFDEVAKIFFTAGYVYGGSTAIIATAADRGHGPDVPARRRPEPRPSCWMQKQPTWYGPDFFPDQGGPTRATSPQYVAR